MFTLATMLFKLIYFVCLVIYTAESAMILESADINNYVLSQVQLTTIIVESKQRNLRPSKLLVRKKQVWKGVDVWDCGGTWRQKFNRTREKLITAKLAIGIEYNLQSTKSVVSVHDAYETAKKHVKKVTGYRKLSYIPMYVSDNFSKKYIFIDETDLKAKLLYSFEFLVIKHKRKGNKLTNAMVKVDANMGTVIDANFGYSNGYEMTGDGGNAVIGKYRYGEDEWAGRPLQVTKFRGYCIPENDHVRVCPSLGSCHVQEMCDPPNRDATETKYSQMHDALFLTTHFLDILMDLYQDRTLIDSEECEKLTVVVEFSDPKQAIYLQCQLLFGPAGPDTLGMVAASTVGHEIGHALLKHTSNLDRYGQAGAIAEAFCDLCGEILKASLNNYEHDWLYGVEVVRDNYTERALRYMNNPPLDGKSIDHAKDFKCGKDEHHMAGVYSKAMYNLAQMDGWPIIKVFQIFLRTNQFFWNTKTSFKQGLCGLLKCAEDFEYNVQDVAEAFASVGVFCELSEERSTDRAHSEPLESDACPRGWQERLYIFPSCRKTYLNTCYKIFDDEVTWAEAFIQCQDLRAKLLTLPNEEISSWIKMNLGLNTKKSYWLGATDLKVENRWMWVNEDIPVEFQDWHKVPKSRTLKNCMSLVKIGRNWGWQDSQCSMKKRFICEIS